MCVEAGKSPRFYGPKSQIGVIYLVAEIFQADTGEIVFQPAGIELGFTEAGAKRGWLLSRFRRVVPACDRASIYEEAKP